MLMVSLKLAMAGACVLVALPAHAQGDSALDLSADVRLRLEQDWDSQTATGTMRDDRLRSRVRVRVNGAYDLGSGLTASARLRTGMPGSQQNANNTFVDFDHNAKGKARPALDRYALGWSGEEASITLGRMALPFFTQNEYFWDGDISPLGIAGNARAKLGSVSGELRGGAFRLPVGIAHYSGELYAAQAVARFGPEGRTTLAAGLFAFEADATDPQAALLLEGNGARDYSVLAINAQHKLDLGGLPLVLGADFYQNLKSYSGATDAFTVANRDQRTGYLVSATLGAASKPGKWQAGYRFSRIERLAVNASYSHDDIARFGSATQAILTGTRAHDIFIEYRLSRPFSIGARAMQVERLNSVEDGKRARLDLVYRF